MNPFLEACGAEGPLQLDVKGRTQGLLGRWTLEKPFALIGRDPRADVVLDHEDVSRRHVYVQVIAGRAFFVDLGSRTGVLRENASQRAGWLDRDQSIGIGPFTVQLQGGVGREVTGPGGNRELDPLSERSSRAVHRTGVVLQFRGRSAWRIRRVLTVVGSAKACKLRLEGSGVARYHCSLVRTSDGMWVVDLGGKDGTTVNGTHIVAARLGEGDVLEVGGFQFHFHADDATPSGRSGLPAVRGPDHRAPETGLRILGHTGLTDRGLAAPVAGREIAPQTMLDQFALMQQQTLEMVQQQMSDQFHQVIQVMAHMVDTLHRDQSNLIREEFDRLRQITEEIQSLSARASADLTRSEGRPALESTLPLPPPSPVGESSEDVHAFIQSRMGALQRERQSRWQRLLELVMGRTGEVATP